MTIEELTKKEQIINFAQSDPFLKISDIADHVQTTPRYVRTILSEANISLMKLREKYARNMEKRLENNETKELQAKVSLKEEYSYNNHNIGEIIIEAVNENNFPDVQRIKQDDELMRIYQIQSVDENPYCVHELITFMDRDINKDRLKNLESIYDLLGRKGINRLQFMQHTLTVEKPGKNMTRFFDREDYLFVSKRMVLLNKISIGVERIYLQSDLTKMEFSGEIVL